jgi:hypothetical protein
MSTTDRILDLIDEGLAVEAPTYGRAGRCDRCEAPADEEVCPACRAFILGDTDVDPGGGPRGPTDFFFGGEVPRPGVPDVLGDGEDPAPVPDDVRCQCPLCWCCVCGAELGGYGQHGHECGPSTAQPLGIVTVATLTSASVGEWTVTVPAMGTATVMAVDAFDAMNKFVEVIDSVDATLTAALRMAEAPEPAHRESERTQLDHRRRSHRRTNRWGPRPGR